LGQPGGLPGGGTEMGGGPMQLRCFRRHVSDKKKNKPPINMPSALFREERRLSAVKRTSRQVSWLPSTTAGVKPSHAQSAVAQQTTPTRLSPAWLQWRDRAGVSPASLVSPPWNLKARPLLGFAYRLVKQSIFKQLWAVGAGRARGFNGVARVSAMLSVFNLVSSETFLSAHVGGVLFN